MPIMNRRHLLVLFLISLFLLLACNFPGVVDQVPTSPILTPDTAQSVYGPGTFSLDLPPGWDVIGPETISSDPNRSYDLYRLGVDPSSSGGPGTSHVIIASASEWTPQELALAQCSTCPPGNFEPLTIGGKPALRTQIGGGDVPILITWYYVEHRGNLIAFAIHDPESLQPLEDVLGSIQFE